MFQEHYYLKHEHCEIRSLPRHRFSSEMLSAVVKDHVKRQEALREERDFKRKEALKASTQLITVLVDKVNDGVSQAYNNQKKIDTETKKLQENAANFSKQVTQWVKLMNDMNISLKELGDVENWSKIMENEMNAIQQCIQLAYEHHEKTTQILKN